MSISEWTLSDLQSWCAKWRVTVSLRSQSGTYILTVKEKS